MSRQQTVFHLGKKSRQLEKAVEAFGDLPPEVAALGKPLSVHPPSAVLRINAQLTEQFHRRFSDPVFMSKLCAALAIGLPVAGTLFLLPYLTGAAFGGLGPEGWLILVVSGLVFGLISGIQWWRYSRVSAGAPAPPWPDQVRSLPGVIVFPDALVHVCKGEFTLIRWQDVETIDAPTAGGSWRITAADGRQIVLPSWIEDDATVIESTVERVTAVLLPRYLDRIEAGKKVRFGPFAVGRRSVYFKDKKIDWDEITSMRILTGRMYCLQIYHGRLLPWCNFDILTAPNGQLVYEVIRRVAPARLLQSA